MMNLSKIHAVIALCCLLSSSSAFAATLYVAVASNFVRPLKAIKGEFQARYPHKIKIIVGSSGKLFAQIKIGAPFDVFLSADREKPLRLVEQGFGEKNSLFTYAVGSLVLWSSDPNFIDKDGEVLAKIDKQYLALANSKLAPYGQAAEQVLQNLNLSDRFDKNLVRGENIGQTLHFVVSGNAKLGFVALSQIIELDKTKQGSLWQVPQSLYDPIRQDAVLLTRSQQKQAARLFLNFLKSDSTRKILAAFGYRFIKD